MIDRKKAISFLQEKAISAYQKGDIGTVRHLSGIALEKVVQDGRKGLDFQDVLWAFVFMIFYSKSNWESAIIIDKAYLAFGPDANRVVDKIVLDQIPPKIFIPRRPTVEISLYAPLINFVLDVFKPDWTKLEEHYKEITGVDISKISDCNDISADLLLTKVIELWWYIDNSSDKWGNLIEKWKSQLPDNSRRYKLIEQLGDRLKIQNSLLYDFELEKIGQLIKQTFSQSNNQKEFLMAQAWFYVFLEEWNKLDELFIQMKKNISFESEYALSFQGLINSTKMLRKMARSTDNIPTDDSTDIAGILRYQRIQLTRPIALFYFQLGAWFDAAALELTKKQHGESSKRANMLALSILLELESLRLWDFGMYISAIQHKREICLELGMYHDMSGQYAGMGFSLKDALILAVRSADSKVNESGEVEKAEKLLEVLPTAKAFINEIVKVIIKTPPVQYSSTLVMLEILEDAVAEEDLKELAAWSVKMFHQYQCSRAHFNLKCFDFWTDIFEYQKISEDVWAILEPVLTVLFKNPNYWRTSGELLKISLCKAPIEKTKKWASIMAMVKIDDSCLEQDQFQILFNSAIENENLKNVVDRYLTQRRATTGTINWEYERKLLNNNHELPTGEADVQRQLIDQLKKRCGAIQSTSKGTFNFYRGLSGAFVRVNWSDCPKEQLYDVLQLIEETMYKSESITTSDVQDLLLILANIVRSASDEFVKAVAELAHKVIEQAPEVYDNSFSGGPLSGFTITKDVKNEIKYAVVRMVSRLYRAINKTEQKYFQKWAISEVCTTEPLNLGFFSTLFFYMYFLGNKDVKERAICGLQIIYVRVQKGKGLTYVLGSLYSVLENTKNNNSNMQPLILKEHQAFLECLNKFIEISYNYPEPEVRTGCALIVRTCDSLGWNIDFGEKIKLKLRNDVRARVRKIFEE
jgi:hypothetical protein